MASRAGCLWRHELVNTNPGASALAAKAGHCNLWFQASPGSVTTRTKGGTALYRGKLSSCAHLARTSRLLPAVRRERKSQNASSRVFTNQVEENPIEAGEDAHAARSSSGSHGQASVSIVIPVFNEVHNIDRLVRRVAMVMQQEGRPYEIICVDDGSSDGTSALLRGLARERRDLKAVLFRRNFGQTAAMAAGFDCAEGDLVVTMDGDLQNDAGDIPRMLHHLLHGGKGSEGRPVAWGHGRVLDHGGYDMVCGWRRQRKDDELTRNFPSRVANWLIGHMTGVRLHDYGCSLKAFRRPLVHHAPRRFGTSKYGLGRIPRVLLDLLTVCLLARFRDRPMRLVGLPAGACLTASALCGAYFVWELLVAARLWGSFAMALSSSFPRLLSALLLLLQGFLLVAVGFVGEIVMRTYYEAQGRSVYRVREVLCSS
eukprot:jgi/Mesen1/4190/ME000219S03322